MPKMLLLRIAFAHCFSYGLTRGDFMPYSPDHHSSDSSNVEELRGKVLRKKEVSLEPVYDPGYYD